MKKKNFLDSVDVPVPCDKSWDEMIGNDVSRFCLHCEKDIYNISAMSGKEARKLLFRSNEKVCIRMEREADGRIKTLKKQLHQITRQVPLAAGILTASMILAGVGDAQEQKTETPRITITQIADKKSKPTISGTITDVKGAVIPGIKITIRNANSTRFATSNTEGFYEFEDVEASAYELEIAEQSGFKGLVYKNLVVGNDVNIEIRLALGIQPTTECVCSDHNSFVTTETPRLDDKITPRQIESLPLPPNRKTFVLGLFPGVKEVKPKKQAKTRQISLTILDPNNAVIVNAKVALKNSKLKKEYELSTNIEGSVNFNEIAFGEYKIEISGNGFRSYKGKIKIQETTENTIKINLKTSNKVMGTFISKP